MANRKISQFTTVTDITTVSGLAGYDATTNVQISGSALISSLQTNLYTPFGSNGDVLTIVGGVPAWAAAGAGSNSTMQQVYTASDAATPNIIGATLITANLDLKNKDVLIQANGPMEFQTATATPHDISLVSSQNIRLISSNDVANPGSMEISANTGEIVMQSLDKVYVSGEDLITFTTSNSTTPYTIEIDASGTLLIQGDAGTSGQVLTSAGTGTQPAWQTFTPSASPLPDVLTAGSTANPGQSITFSGGGGIINVFSITGSDTNGSNEVKASGGNVEINSVSNDVVIKGGGNLILENTGLGTPASGDYLTANGTTGEVQWTTEPKAFVTLTGSPTWVIRNGYNATWNIAAGSETLSITADDGDSGTLVVINAGGEITWPANSNWPNSAEPTLTATGTDVFSFIYDGTNYYWSFGQNFGA